MAKLFLVDLAEAPPIARISLFAGIGIALLAVGYWLGDDTGATADAAGDTDDEKERVEVPESIG